MSIRKKAFSRLIDELKGLEWCFFSGFAAKLYYDRERECEDLDILVRDKDLEILAERLGTEVKERDYTKDNGISIRDFGFETKSKGLEVEATSGFPKWRVDEGLIDKIFGRREEREFMGKKIYLIPIEELIVHKASMFRDKDEKDLKGLKEKDYNTDFLKELAEDWHEKEKILSNLRKVGYDVK